MKFPNLETFIMGLLVVGPRRNSLELRLSSQHSIDPATLIEYLGFVIGPAGDIAHLYNCVGAKRIDNRRNNMKFDRPNDPNAGRLVESLRYLGYGNYEAISDLVDNSIDADAEQIYVRVQQRETQIQISIADNGTGMDLTTLDQAMRLGSLTSRDLNSDLGKFGMGLVTASLSIAKRCHVITKTADGYLSSAWDVDEIVTKNAFLKHLGDATSEERSQFDSLVGDSKTGTVVILTKCDNLTIEHFLNA